MNPSILCTWLGLKQQCWPPDPYALLGITPEEKDVANIEQKVHERLCKLRNHQISHPEEATEGMNRLAQAFIQITDCLSRQECKKPVVTAVAALPGNGKKTSTPTVNKDDTAVGLKTAVDWRNTPPPVRLAPEADKEPVVAPREDLAVPTAALPAPAPSPLFPPAIPGPVQAVVEETKSPTPPSPTPPPPDLAHELAHFSPEAREGLGTAAGLLRRIQLTRKLSAAWTKVGKYLRNPRRRLAGEMEETGLTRRMDGLFEIMEDYPGFLGHPGKPGYRVVGMARWEMTASIFKAMDLAQREELAKDWAAGDKVLREHHRFLLQQLKKMKRRGGLNRALTAFRDFLARHSLWAVFLSLGLISAGLFLLFRGW